MKLHFKGVLSPVPTRETDGACTPLFNGRTSSIYGCMYIAGYTNSSSTSAYSRQ